MAKYRSVFRALAKCKEPHGADARALMLLHAESLAEHGGLWGLRDEAALESSLARPRHLQNYRKEADIAALAAAYGWGSSATIPSTTVTSGLDFLPLVCFWV
jgi:death-on-curing protein